MAHSAGIRSDSDRHTFGYGFKPWVAPPIATAEEILSYFVCWPLNHMRDTGATSITPALRPEDEDMALFDWMDEDSFNPNYLKRAQSILPRRGDKREWQHTQDYWREKDEFPAIDLDDAAFVYSGGARSDLAAG